MRRISLTLTTILIAAACLAAQEPASRQGAAVSSGNKTIVGCVAQGSSGFVIKTDDGNTFPLRSMTDLSGYMGKKVQIQANWTATGVHVAGPLESPETPATAPGTGGSTGQEFAGDIHLRLKGKVIGDCLGKK
jgi:hypothetical protein